MIIGIIGLGRLGSALARGLDRAKKDIVLFGYSRNQDKARELALKVKSIKLCDSEKDIFEHCGIIFLWTKGPDAAEVLKNNEAVIQKLKPIIVTCTSGIPLDSYTDRWAETLPNVNMPAGKGVTLINFSRMMEASDRSAVIELLSMAGNVYETRPEDMPYYSAISSCGPALYATIMELIADTLSKHRNYDREICRRIVRETFLGTIMLQDQDRIDAAELVRRVAHPGGPSEAGVSYLNFILPQCLEEMLKKMKKW